MSFDSHDLDRILLDQSPLLPVPPSGNLPELPLDRHRWLVAEDGLYLEARTAALHALAPMAKMAANTAPYGQVRPFLRLAGGPLASSLVAQIREKACQCCPLEYLGLIYYAPAEAAYRLFEPPPLSVGPDHVRIVAPRLPDQEPVVDIHSHGQGRAYFSAVDDRDDLFGIHLAAVLGGLLTVP